MTTDQHELIQEIGLFPSILLVGVVSRLGGGVFARASSLSEVQLTPENEVTDRNPFIRLLTSNKTSLSYK